MRVANFNPNRFDQEFENVSIKRLVEAAEVIAGATRRNCPIGTISRPMYKSGPYAGQYWTARDVGELKRSIRVVRRRTKSGKAFTRKRNVRVYAGHKKAYYASIVEHSKPFMRPAQSSTLSQVKTIVGAT